MEIRDLFAAEWLNLSLPYKYSYHFGNGRKYEVRISIVEADDESRR